MPAQTSGDLFHVVLRCGAYSGDLLQLFPFSSVHCSCDSFSLVLNRKQALSTAVVALPPLPCQQQQSPRDGHNVDDCTRQAPLNAAAATTTTAAAATASAAVLSHSPTSFKMTRNTRIIFGAGVDVGAERRGGRAMAMSKMTTMTMHQKPEYWLT